MEAPIDQKSVTNLLLKAEQGVHRAGWDQDPFLGVLYWVRPGELRLVKSEFPVAAPPGEFVANFGKMVLSNPAFGAAMVEDLDSRFFGWAFVNEAWSVEQTAQEARERYASDDPSISTLPDRVEIRLITAVDIYARTYMVGRQRGKKPVDWTDDERLRDVGGRIHQGLVDMVLGCVRQNPSFFDRLPDLETLFVPTIDELLDVDDLLGKRSPHSGE